MGGGGGNASHGVWKRFRGSQSLGQTWSADLCALAELVDGNIQSPEKKGGVPSCRFPYLPPKGNGERHAVCERKGKETNGKTTRGRGRGVEALH